MNETFAVVAHEVAVTHAPTPIATATPPPGTPPTTTAPTSSSTLSTGAIVGIVIGCIVFISLIAFLIWYFNSNL